jgi:small subunit ribosomal protein S15
MSLDKNNKAKVIKSFAINDQDTGSAQVQVALLTEKIKDVAQHLEKNPKDVSSKRGLLQAVANRKSFLEYLKKHNASQYKEIVNRLGLRK